MSNALCDEMYKQLSPCPFCGGPAYYVRSVNGSQMHHVGCASCGVDIKAAEIHYPDPSKDHLSKDIVAAWNRRATPLPEDVAGLIEEARKPIGVRTILEREFQERIHKLADTLESSEASKAGIAYTLERSEADNERLSRERAVLAEGLKAVYEARNDTAFWRDAAEAELDADDLPGYAEAISATRKALALIEGEKGEG